MSPDARRLTASVLVVLTSLLLVAATVAGYARRAFVDSGQFADRATATLRDPSVRTLVGERVTDQVVLHNQADLLAARPVIASAIGSVIGGAAFRSLFRRAALDVHGAVLDHDENTITLTLVDVGTVASAALKALDPKVAAKVQASGRVVVTEQRIGSATGDLARTARTVRVLAFILAALTLVAAAAALVVSPDRRHTSSRLGLGIAAAGVTVVIAYTIARAIVLARFDDPEDRAAAAGVWGAFLGDLRTWGWLLAGAGAVVAAAAASLIRPVAIEDTMRRGWDIATTEPRAAWLRVARGAAIVAAGVLVILDPVAALNVAATLVGVYLVFKGLEAILRVIYRPPDPAAVAERTPARRRRLARRIAVPAIAALLIAGAATVLVSGGGASAPAATSAGCNGHRALCDRRLDEVVLPATHNSMSAPLPGWFSSEQERPIGGQLADGIRGLLLDTHYADKLPNGRVRTYFASAADVDLIKGQDGVSPQSFEAAQRLRDRLGFKGEGTRGMYLCHTFCELGATPLQDGLKDIHDFLVTHPSEVMVVINQDYVTPADFVQIGRGRGPDALRVHATGRRRLADPGPDDRVRPAAGPAGREPRGRCALVPARVQAPDRGDAVHVPQRVAAHREVAPRRQLPAQPRAVPRAPVPHQPLGQHGSSPEAQRRLQGQRVRAAAAPRARLRAHPPPPAEPARGELLQARRRVPRGGHAQRRRAKLTHASSSGRVAAMPPLPTAAPGAAPQQVAA
jgi:hypothetical protein